MRSPAVYTGRVSFFDRLKSSLQKTKEQLFGTFDADATTTDAGGAAATGTRTRRIESLDALEEALITCDVGVAATDRIVEQVRRQARRGDDVFPGRSGAQPRLGALKPCVRLSRP